MPGILRGCLEATLPDDPHACWQPATPSMPSRPRKASFLEVSQWRTSFGAGKLVAPKGLDDVQRTEYGEPFIGSRDVGKVAGPRELMKLAKGGAEGYLKKKIQEAYDELEMNVGAADLDPYTDQATDYAVSAQTAAWKATRAAEQSLRREAGLGRVPAKVDHAWKAAMQAIRMAHSQRLVDQQLDITRQDRHQVSEAVEELVDNLQEAVEQEDPTQQGMAVEAVKRGVATLQDLQEKVEEDFDKLEQEQKLLEAELQEAQTYPLYPSRDYVVAAVPEPGDPAPPETIIGTMDTEVPKAEDMSQMAYKM